MSLKETHILHDFGQDLYGHILKVCIVDYLRPEKDFNSLAELIAAIKNDIEQCKQRLESDETAAKLKDNEFFRKSLEQRNPVNSNF